MNRDEIPPLPKRNPKRLAMLFHRKRVQGITKKLYTLQPAAPDLVASRTLKSQINLLKSTSIRVSRYSPSHSFSSIRAISLSMLKDMTRSKRHIDLSQSHLDLEDTPEASFILQDGVSRPRPGRLRPSVLEMKALSQQMSPALHRNEEVLKEEEEKRRVAAAEPRNSTAKRECTREIVGKEVDIWGIKRELQGLKDNCRDLTRKIKLFVTSIALLEDEMRVMVADCLEFKRNLLRKKLDAAYNDLRKARREKDSCREQYIRLERQVKALGSLPSTPFAMD